MLGLTRQPSILRIGAAASRGSFRSSLSARPSLRTKTTSAAEVAAPSESFAKRNPFAFQVGVATVKTSAADLMAQVVVEKKVRLWCECVSE